MSQPAFGQEREIKENDGDAAARDEERLQSLCSNVGNIPRNEQKVYNQHRSRMPYLRSRDTYAMV